MFTQFNSWKYNKLDEFNTLIKPVALSTNETTSYQQQVG